MKVCDTKSLHGPLSDPSRPFYGHNFYIPFTVRGGLFSAELLTRMLGCRDALPFLDHPFSLTITMLD